MPDNKGQNERGAVQPRHETMSGQDLGDLQRGGGMDTSVTPRGADPLKNLQAPVRDDDEKKAE